MAPHDRNYNNLRDKIKRKQAPMIVSVERVGQNDIPSVKERLVEEGYNPSYGARPLRRAVMRLLEDSLAEEVLSGRIKNGDKAEVDIDESKKVIVKHLGKDSSKPELASAAV